MSEETHWGPDPGHGGLTQHKGSRADCSGPDCGSDDGSHFWQAVQRLDASDYQWQESGFDGGLREAMVAQVHSNLAVVHELRRLNEGRDQWYREVLEVLTQAKDPEGSPVGSGQPAAAPACPVCGNEGYRFGCEPGTAITRVQWLAHHEAYYRDSQDYGANKTNAAYYADRQTEDRFGPCPEES